MTSTLIKRLAYIREGGGARGPKRRPVLDRVLAMVSPEPNSGCWLWTGSIKPNGYGAVGFRIDGRQMQRRAHRVTYELLCGPIPAGLQLDHLCRVRSCVNPAHLEPVTQQVNHARGLRGKASHCTKGHPLEPGNLYVHPDGKKRTCLICRAARSKADYARQMAARAQAVQL